MVKKIIFLLTIGIIIIGKNYAYADSHQPQINNLSEKLTDQIHAKSWVIMDQKTGKILLQKDMNERHYPASITKIATAIYAIEHGNIKESVSVSESAAQTPGSSLYLHKGDTLPLKDLLYGIMLHSGNDGAVAIAEHFAGSEQSFTKKVTSFAQSLGTKNTNFTNASGLHDKNHYTNAYDMAIIARHAMDNQLFRQIASSKTYEWDRKYWTDQLKIHEKDDAKQVDYHWRNQQKLINHNRLLFNYDGATGIKNGFTHQSRYTLVGSAKRGNKELIVVVLRSPDRSTAYQDVTKLLDEGFQAYESILKDEEETEGEESKKDKQSVSEFNNSTSMSVGEDSGTEISAKKETEEEQTMAFKWMVLILLTFVILTLLIYKLVGRFKQ